MFPVDHESVKFIANYYKSHTIYLALSPGHSQLFNVHEKSGRDWYAMACDHPNHKVK